MQFLHSFSRLNWCLVNTRVSNEYSLTWHFLPTHARVCRQYGELAIFTVLRSENVNQNLTNNKLIYKRSCCWLPCILYHTWRELREVKLFIAVKIIVHFLLLITYFTNLSSCVKTSTWVFSVIVYILVNYFILCLTKVGNESGKG